MGFNEANKTFKAHTPVLCIKRLCENLVQIPLHKTLAMTASKKWRDEGAALFAVRVDGVIMAHGLWGWPRGRNELKTKNANDSAGNTVNVDF